MFSKAETQKKGKSTNTTARPAQPDILTLTKILKSNPLILRMFLENKTPADGQMSLLAMIQSNPALLSALTQGGAPGGGGAGGGLLAALQSNPGLLAQLGGAGAGAGGGGLLAALQSNPGLLAQLGSGGAGTGAGGGGLAAALQSNPGLLAQLGAGGAGTGAGGGGLLAALQSNPGLLAQLGAGGAGAGGGAGIASAFGKGAETGGPPVGGGGLLAALQSNPGLLAQLGGGGGGGLLSALQSNPGLLAQLGQGSGSASGGLAGAIQNNPALLAALTKGQQASSTSSPTPSVSTSFSSSKYESAPSNHLEPSYTATSVRVLPPLKLASTSEVILPASSTVKPASPEQVPPRTPAVASASATAGPPTKSPSGVDLSSFLKNPAVQKLVKEHPEIVDDFNKASQSGDLVGLLGNPVIAKFVQENPSVVSDFINGPSEKGREAPDPSINAALASLAAPPPPGAKEGIFGVDLFAGMTLFLTKLRQSSLILFWKNYNPCIDQVLLGV